MGKSQIKLFKPYRQNQVQLLPPSLDSLIEPSHPVRRVSDLIDQIDISPLIAQYSGRGASSYHPRMMLKVLVYGYMRNIYSSRKLEMAIKENIHFMWLAGGNQPDHHSINRFRSGRLKESLKTIFSQLVLLFHEAGYLSIKQLYTDGTKLEANANRYTFVWSKASKNNRQRVGKQLEELWSYAVGVAKEELMDTQPCDFEQLAPEEVAQTLKKIDQALQKVDKQSEAVAAHGGKEELKKKRQKLTYAKKAWPENLKKYEEQQAIAGDRNSYSKTDPDATFMRLKDDHMQNGQLKPAYNLQCSSNEQFILHYSLHQNPGDTLTLIPHLEGFEQSYGQMPEEITADSGYGSEQNYQYLEEQQVQAYVKYNYFHKEQRKRYAEKNSFKPSQLYYNAEQDYYVCPIGQKMTHIGQHTKKTASGFIQHLDRYQAQNCEGCPLRAACHKSKHNRIITINHQLNHYRQKAKEKLNSEEGIKRRKKRPCEIEAVFGILKQNRNFRRLSLRGLEKVEIEVGLHAVAHNFRKLAAKMSQKKGKDPLFPFQEPKRELHNTNQLLKVA